MKIATLNYIHRMLKNDVDMLNQQKMEMRKTLDEMEYTGCSEIEIADFQDDYDSVYREYRKAREALADFESHDFK